MQYLQALAAFERVMNPGGPGGPSPGGFVQVAICPTDWSIYRRRHETQIDPRLRALPAFRGPPAPSKETNAAKGAKTQLKTKVELPVSQLLLKLLQDIMHFEEVDGDADLIDLGMD